MNRDLLIVGKKILVAKEKRYLKRLNFSENSNCIIELSLNVPGIPKVGPMWKLVFRLCVKAIEENIPSQLLFSDVNIAGYYAVFNSYISLTETKIRSCLIEEEAGWGRLVDIDCFKGNKKISRKDIGLKERKCMICSNPNSVCIGKHLHSVEELRKKAEVICKNLKWR